MHSTSGPETTLPSGNRRILLIAAASLGVQCVVPLGVSLVGVIMAGPLQEGPPGIVAASGEVYAEAVNVYSAFLLILIIVVVEYALRKGDEPRTRQEFLQGISTVALWSAFVAGINVLVYLALALVDREGDAWYRSPAALTFLAISGVALSGAVSARVYTRRVLMRVGNASIADHGRTNQ